MAAADTIFDLEVAKTQSEAASSVSAELIAARDEAKAQQAALEARVQELEAAKTAAESDAAHFRGLSDSLVVEMKVAVEALEAAHVMEQRVRHPSSLKQSDLTVCAAAQRQRIA